MIMVINKQLFLILLLTIGFAQPALAMEPERNQNRQTEEVREIQRQRWLQQNAPTAPIVPVAQPEEAVVAEPGPPIIDEETQQALYGQLLAAIQINDLTQVEKTITNRVNVNHIPEIGPPPLIQAIWYSDVPICQILISNGANINFNNGFTALHWTAMTLLPEMAPICDLLLKPGANVHILDHNGKTALDHAIALRRLDICQLLREAGANEKNQTPSLEEAALRGDATVVARLLTNPSQIKSQSEQCAQALTWAAMNGHESTCKLLLGTYAHADILDQDNMTALMRAAQNGHDHICELLIHAGATINMISKLSVINGSTTALQEAIRGKHISTCKLLIKHGADINIINHLSEAQFREDVPLLILLLENGAALKNKLCTPALALEAEGNRLNELKILIAYASFNPFRTEAQIREAENQVHTARLALIRACPHLPRDVRDLIFLAEPELRLDFCCVATNIHRNKHNRVPFMPLQVVSRLIEKGMLKPNETVKVIRAHNYECLRPLMLQALPVAQTDEMKELLNPDNLDANFGDEIKQNIERKLNLPKTNRVNATDSVLDLQANKNENKN